jgi:hypothetical protein
VGREFLNKTKKTLQKMPLGFSLCLGPKLIWVTDKKTNMGQIGRCKKRAGLRRVLFCWVAPFPQLQPPPICPPVRRSHGALLLPAAPPPAPPPPRLPRLRAGPGTGGAARVLEAQRLPGQLGARGVTPGGVGEAGAAAQGVRARRAGAAEGVRV